MVMEEKVNIAEILKDKPQGTKLYDLLRNIDVKLDEVHITDVGTYIECTSTNEVGSTLLFDYSKLGTEESWLEGLRILLPSKNMRDWGKFAWKKGDLLVNSCGFQCIFKEWASDDYTKFNGCYSNSRDGYEDVLNAETAKFDKLDNNTAYGYIREIENRCGGKLNLETLEIEKPEFKDGDILSNPSTVLPKNHIFIFSKFNKYKDFEYHVALIASGEIIIPTSHGVWCRKDSCVKYATEEEKKQLFSALEKKGQAWDAEKKQIVDLKPKIEFKPFDKVVVRDTEYSTWCADLFSHIDEDYRYACVGATWSFCIPYNEETAKLIGTTNNVEG
jgi:hypothetical protein